MPLATVQDTLRNVTIESTPVLKKLGTASRALAELKGLANAIPQPEILINCLTFQEAKDSSAIESIITTHDELFKDDLFPEDRNSPAAKEVLHYREALKTGFSLVRGTGLLTVNHIVSIQQRLEHNDAGFRRLPGTTLQDGTGAVIYTPPQDHSEIVKLMDELQTIINDPSAMPFDPLIKMAIIHYQFESIHPFYDGNGRTGRIINVLYLVKEGLLDHPILYHSRYIVRNKGDYYSLIQSVRDKGEWEAWILFLLTAVETTAKETACTVSGIKHSLTDYKRRIRENFKFYSQDLVNSLFNHPYTKVAFIERDLGVSRVTASRYLDELTEAGLLEKQRLGRSNYYVNRALNSLLTGTPLS